MLRNIKRLAIGCLMGVFLMNTVVLPTDISGEATVEAAALTAKKGKVSAKKLHIRTKKSTSSKCIKTVKKGKKVKLLSTGSKWVKVSVNGKVGYTQGRYLSTTYGNASDLDADSVSGDASKKLSVYASKSTKGSVLTTVKKGSNIKVLTTDKKWVKVKVNGVVGYALGKDIATANGGTASDTTTKGESVVSYALRFVGNPYRWGGTSLTNGADCSGFVMSVYRHFGISLPHSSAAQRSCGKSVGSLSKAKPGDIICYSGHVAIYMGNNKIVHASNPKDGIKISSNASYRHIVSIRRIFN